jgi:hypothetical protein
MSDDSSQTTAPQPTKKSGFFRNWRIACGSGAKAPAGELPEKKPKSTDAKPGDGEDCEDGQCATVITYTERGAGDTIDPLCVPEHQSHSHLSLVDVDEKQEPHPISTVDQHEFHHSISSMLDAQGYGIDIQTHNNPNLEDDIIEDANKGLKDMSLTDQETGARIPYVCAPPWGIHIPKPHEWKSLSLELAFDTDSMTKMDVMKCLSGDFENQQGCLLAATSNFEESLEKQIQAHVADAVADEVKRVGILSTSMPVEEAAKQRSDTDGVFLADNRVHGRIIKVVVKNYVNVNTTVPFQPVLLLHPMDGSDRMREVIVPEIVTDSTGKNSQTAVGFIMYPTSEHCVIWSPEPRAKSALEHGTIFQYDMEVYNSPEARRWLDFNEWDFLIDGLSNASLISTQVDQGRVFYRFKDYTDSTPAGDSAEKMKENNWCSYISSHYVTDLDRIAFEQTKSREFKCDHRDGHTIVLKSAFDALIQIKRDTFDVHNACFNFGGIGLGFRPVKGNRGWSDFFRNGGARKEFNACKPISISCRLDIVYELISTPIRNTETNRESIQSFQDTFSTQSTKVDKYVSNQTRVIKAALAKAAAKASR